MNLRSVRLALLIAVLGLAAGCAAGFQTSGGPDDIVEDSTPISFYFDELAPYGTWVDVSPYGWVWCPLDTPVGWHPYTVGYWAYSDEGWLWVSEDPWGWIPYHYGRWSWQRSYGWFWVPGDIWAPAWVAWRYGPDWVGWAPLPPDVDWRSGIGLMYGDDELDRRIHRYRWSFTPSRDFGTARERPHVEAMSRNVTLLGMTRNITKYAAAPRPIEQGMSPDLFRTREGPPIQRYQIIDSGTPIREQGVTFRERSVEVYRPEKGVTETVRDRVRNVPKTERPIAQPRAVERIRQEKTQVDDVVKQQRKELADEHVREMQERPPGASALELQQRQLEELRSQREVEERQKQELEARERQVAKQQEAAARAQEKATKERQRDEAQAQRQVKVPKGELKTDETKPDEPKADEGKTKTRSR